MPINIDFEGTDVTVLAWMRGQTDGFTQKMLRKMNYLMLRLQQKIVGEKLSGQVLNQRSGLLAGGVQVIPAEIEGDVLVSGVSSLTWYGIVHEEGPHTIVPVNKKWLRFMMNGKEVFAKSVFLPERKFMRPALGEMRNEILHGLSEAMNE
jgi:hypothetical protein